MESTSGVFLGASFCRKHGREMVVSRGHKAFSDRAMRTTPQGLALMLCATSGPCGQLFQEHEILPSDGISENKKHDRVWGVSCCKINQEVNHQVCPFRQM